jgi:uncharacterized protein
MRREEKRILGQSEIESILLQSIVCRIALCDNKIPYIVPLIFGYKNNVLYFHCAPEGRKLDIIRENPNVCFEAETGVEIVKGDTPCHWSAKYKSVIGNGRAYFVEDREEKRIALAAIMEHYAPGAFEFNNGEVDRVTIVCIIIETMAGKQSGY